MQWKYPKECVKVDVSEGVMKVAGEDVLKVSVIEDKVMLDWLDTSWTTWDLLQTSHEFKQLVHDAGEKVKKNRSQNSKGVGKGPHQ